MAKITYTYDGLGNLIQEVSFEPNDQPVFGSEGFVEMRISYDQYGNGKEMAFFGRAGQLVTSKELGDAGITRAYDDHGNIVPVTVASSGRWFS